jgi:hypothetical protein
VPREVVIRCDRPWAGEDLSGWTEKPVRLRVQLRDAELFAFRFPRD